MSNAPIYLEAPITVNKETTLLRERASSIIDLPKDEMKQLDLMYFTAIFVSSGENLNHAFFEPVELVMAENTIVNKALDIEHKEKEIIGHLYDRVFITEKGEVLNLEELKALDKSALNGSSMHIAIAGIIYKNRFPEVAQEVADQKWKVSMEAYYKDFDIKIGTLVLTRKEAEVMGVNLESSNINNVIGKVGKVIKDGKEIASGVISRVLRTITFSGCGIVENPANPPSVILEVATHKAHNTTDVVTTKDIIFDYSKPLKPINNLTSIDRDGIDKEIASEPVIVHNDTVGVCVSYKKRVEDKDGTLLNENWCSKFSTDCTSFSREATDPGCLLNKISESVASAVKVKLNNKRVEYLLKDLASSLKKV